MNKSLKMRRKLKICLKIQISYPTLNQGTKNVKIFNSKQPVKQFQVILIIEDSPDSLV